MATKVRGRGVYVCVRAHLGGAEPICVIIESRVSLCHAFGSRITDFWVLFQVSWVRNRDIHVLTVGRFTFTNDDRFFSHHEDGSNEWVLRLRLVSSP